MLNVWISGEQRIGNRVVQAQVFAGAQRLVEHRLCQRHRVQRRVAQLRGTVADTGSRSDIGNVGVQQNKQAMLGPGLFDRGAHHRFDQTVQDDLAGDCLRDLEHRCQVEMFNWRNERGDRIRLRLFGTQKTMTSLQLPHLASSPPTQIGITCVAQVDAGYPGQTASAVEPCGQFVGQRLDMEQTIVLSQLNGLLVLQFGFEQLPGDARHFRADQRHLTGEGLCTQARPRLQLFMMLTQTLQSTGVSFAVGRQGQSRVEMVFGLLEKRRNHPQKSLRLGRALSGRRVIPGQIARLQLAYPVLAARQRQIRRTGQMRFDSCFIEPLIVETAERRRLPAQHADQRQLAAHEIRHQTETDLLCIDQP